MAITWKWKRTKDSEPMTHIAVTHSLSRADLADLLIAGSALDPGTEPLPDLSRAEIERRIRSQLWWNREAADWWGEKHADDYHTDLIAWADGQVDKLNPPAHGKRLADAGAQPRKPADDA